MDAKQILNQAWAAVRESEVPESLHPVALEQAIRLIAGPNPVKAREVASPDPGKATGKATTKKAPVAGAETDGSETAAVDDEDAFFQTFAAESDVDEERLRQVYMVRDGQVRLALTKRKLGDSEASKNRNIAQLTVAPRWYVDGKQQLSIGEVRDVAKTFGYTPSRNLSSHMEGVPGTQAVGVKNDKAVRVQSGKFDAPFAELINRLTAE